MDFAKNLWDVKGNNPLPETENIFEKLYRMKLAFKFNYPGTYKFQELKTRLGPKG